MAVCCHPSTRRYNAEVGGRGPPSPLFSLPFLLFSPPAPRHSLIVTRHTIDPLASLGEHQLVYSLLADATVEAMGMIRVFSGHDGLVEDRQPTDVAAVGAVGAYGGAVGEQEEIGVGGDLVVALCASEAINVEE